MCLKFYNAFKGDPKRSNILGPIKAETNACFIPTTQNKAWINKQTNNNNTTTTNFSVSKYCVQLTLDAKNNRIKQLNQKQISILHLIFHRLTVV